jgi:hypothetical protein
MALLFAHDPFGSRCTLFLIMRGEKRRERLNDAPKLLRRRRAS